MEQLIKGIHHVTALAGDPQRNLDFYAGILGLRLVKKLLILTLPMFTIFTMEMKPANPAQSLPSSLTKVFNAAGMVTACSM